MSWTLDGRPLRRVLVTRLRYLGDIVMSTVVLAVLKRGDPDLEIEFLCEAAHAPLLDHHPLLSAVHALGVRRHGRDAAARRAAAKESGGGTRGTLGTVTALRGRRFDLAIDLFFNPRSAWLLRLARIPRRIGGTASRTRGRLYTHLALAPSAAECPPLYAVASGALGHHLSRLAPLRAADGRPFLDWLADEVPPAGLAPEVNRPSLDDRIRQSLRELGVGAGSFVLLAPAATWPTKAWPLERWRDLIAELLAAGRSPVILSPPGGAGPYAALAAAVPDGRGGLLPPLGLRAALAVVGAAGTLISVDGGIMHAGVGMAIPTVALFGPTDPDIWFPYERLGPYRVLATRPHCHPCGRHQCDQFICLPDLDVGTVAAAVDALAGVTGGGGS